MTGKNYLETQMMIVEIGKKVYTLDIDAFLLALRNAEAAAPMLDPSLYRKAQANLAAIRKLAESLQPVKAAFEEVFTAVLNTTVVGYMEKSPSEAGRA